jgi:chaperone required for assembly of F1-ATPase
LGMVTRCLATAPVRLALSGRLVVQRSRRTLSVAAPKSPSALPAYKPDNFQRPRRFYKAVDTAPDGAGVAVRLDGRVPKSPGKHPIILPTTALAELVGGEWDVQGEFVVYANMPATRLAHSALDAVSAHRAETAAEVARFAGSDLICYFAEHPRSLVERQEAQWEPLLRWADQELGLLFIRGAGVVHQAQPPETLEAVRALAAAQDDFGLAGLAFGTALFGSAILALALQRGRINGDTAFSLSRLDEIFQEERWGVDAEAAARADALAADAIMLERWFRALG